MAFGAGISTTFAPVAFETTESLAEIPAELQQVLAETGCLTACCPEFGRLALGGHLDGTEIQCPKKGCNKTATTDKSGKTIITGTCRMSVEDCADRLKTGK